MSPTKAIIDEKGNLYLNKGSNKMTIQKCPFRFVFCNIEDCPIFRIKNGSNTLGEDQIIINLCHNVLYKCLIDNFKDERK